MNTDLGPIDQRLRKSAGTPSDQDERLLADQDERLLERIEDALARLEDGRFGYCESCGGEIAIARLMLDPATRRCGGCGSE